MSGNKFEKPHIHIFGIRDSE